MSIWKKFDNPEEGLPVVYLGVYVTKWKPEWGEPDVAFVLDEETENKLKILEEETFHFRRESEATKMALIRERNFKR
jgi:hypothetical protein